MSGKINFINYVIVFISVFASVTDLAWGKIFNWFTVPTALLGFMVSTYLMGWNGSSQSVLGVVAGFIFYGWMFGLRFVGGGDVKLLMALGAWGGFHFTEEVAILGVILGGVFSLAVLICTGRIIDFIRRMYAFLLSLYVTQLEIQVPKIDKTLTLPFGVPISIAAVWVAFDSPLEKWGISLWP